MSDGTKKLLYWTPRVLCIAFALFLSIFALDVFDAGYSFGETIVALFMHLIPVYMVIAALVIAWRWEWTGGVLFTALGLFYIYMTWNRAPLLAYVFISGPAFLLAALFLANWFYRADLRPKAEAS
jgi:hypothetical protein